MKYLFCIDVDGTLLNESSELTKETINFIKNNKNDHLFCIVTGRGYKNIIDIYNKLELNTLLGTNGGTIIYDTSTDKSLVSNNLNNNEISKFRHIFKDELISVLLETKDGTFVNNKESFFASWNLSKNSLICDLDTIKDDLYCVFTLVKNENIKKITDYVDSLKEYKTRIWSNDDKSNITLLEICSTVYHKGSCLDFLSNYYKGKFDKTVAIGDNYNDIDMFNVADISVLMKNGKVDLMSTVDVVTNKTNSEDGLIDYIKNLIEC